MITGIMRPFEFIALSGWPYAAGIAIAIVDLVASVHVVVRKRDVRAAIGWVGLIWLVPGVGAFPKAMRNLRELELDVVISELLAGGMPICPAATCWFCCWMAPISRWRTARALS